MPSPGASLRAPGVTRSRSSKTRPGAWRLLRMEHNVTGIDYADRAHFRYRGPLIDVHAHVLQTRPDDPPTGPPKGTGPGASLEQAEVMLAVAEEFGITQTV